MRPDDLGADEHGGDLAAHPGTRLDFSVSLNPLGMPAEVRAALAAAIDETSAYPDPQCRVLRQALAAHHGVPAGRIVCGNGASDLIYRIGCALHPRLVLEPAPTFTEYERSCGAPVVRYPLDARANFDLDDGFLDAMDGVDLVFCCQPNNPTGRLIDPGLLGCVVQRAAQTGAVLVVDECFLPFTDAASSISRTDKYQNLIVLRAFTKTHALAGVRLGYAVTGEVEMARAIADAGPRWNVSTLAQAAGLAALGVTNWDEATRRVVSQERGWVSAQLAALGLGVTPSQANFILFRSPVDLFQPLLARGILLRHCGNFPGLDDTYWRVGLRCHADNAVLIDALREVLHG